MFKACLSSKQRAGLSWTISCKCCHTDIEAADQTCYLTQSPTPYCCASVGGSERARQDFAIFLSQEHGVHSRLEWERGVGGGGGGVGGCWWVRVEEGGDQRLQGERRGTNLMYSSVICRMLVSRCLRHILLLLFLLFLFLLLMPSRPC